MQVQVAAEHVPAARARLIALARAQLLEAKRALALDSVLREVELVAAQLRAGLAEHRIPHELGLDVADHLELLFHRCLAGQHIAHRVFRAREILERVHEVHVAAAFCVDGHALFRGLLDGSAHCGIFLQLRSEHLGKAAAEEEAVDIRELCVVQRAERHEHRTFMLEHGEAGRVVEGERLIARDADAARALRHLPEVKRLGLELRREAGEVQDSLDVERLGDGRAHRLNGLPFLCILGDGH